MLSRGLRELQIRFQEAIVEGDGSPADRLPMDRRGVLEDLAPLPGLSELDRLGIYSYAYFGRLEDSLREDFEQVAQAVDAVRGDPEAFSRLTREYLRACPSRYAGVAEVSRSFPDFLAREEAAGLRTELPFLADLARLEWSLVEVFYDDLRPLLDPARLGEIPADAWPGICFRLDASVRLLESPWPVHDLWEQTPSPELLADLGKLAGERPARLAVYAQDGCSDFLSLDAQAFGVLRLLARGASLAEVCAELEAGDSSAESPPPLMQWLSNWIELGIIRGW